MDYIRLETDRLKNTLQLSDLQIRILQAYLDGITDSKKLAEQLSLSESKLKYQLHSMDAGVRRKLVTYLDRLHVGKIHRGEDLPEEKVPRSLSKWPDFLLRHGFATRMVRD